MSKCTVLQNCLFRFIPSSSDNSYRTDHVTVKMFLSAEKYLHLNSRESLRMRLSDSFNEQRNCVTLNYYDYVELATMKK